MIAVTGQDRRPLHVVALLLVLFLAWILHPVLGAVVLGGFAALVAHGPHERFVTLLGGRRSLAAGLATAIITLAVLLPLMVVIAYAAREATESLRVMSADGTAIRAYGAFVGRLPPAVRESLPTLIENARAAALELASSVPPLVPGAIASSARFLVSVLLAIVTMFALLRDGGAMVAFLRRVSPLPSIQTCTLISEVRQVALGLFRGGLLVSLFHGASASLGLLIFGVPQVILLGVLCAVASFVPIAGTGLISVPLVVGFALTGEMGKAVALLVWFAAVVGASDQLLRPWVSKGRMVLPRPLLFLTIFGGLQVFGPMGLLLGPLVGSLAVVALTLVARDAP